MLRKVVCAGGVVLDGPRVLLVEGRADGFSFPKGHVKPDECAEQAALREVGEETGVKARIIEFLGIVTRRAVDYEGGDVPEIVEKDIVMFLMEAVGRTNLPTEPDCVPAWPEVEHAIGRMTHPEDGVFLRERVLPLVNVAPYEHKVA